MAGKIPKSAWKKGTSGNPAGKPKGAKNKFTTLKQAFINAFTRIGGEDALYEWLTPTQVQVKNKKGEVIRILDFGGDRKKEFFKMMASMLPRDVTLSGNPDAPLQFQNIKGMIEHASDGGESEGKKPGMPEKLEKKS